MQKTPVKVFGCKEGYSGATCTDYYCNNILYTTTATVCGGQGTCTAPDTCSCNTGYSGKYCDVISCFGVLSSAPASSICSGHGSCGAPNTCSCTGGYTGLNCKYSPTDVAASKMIHAKYISREATGCTPKCCTNNKK